MPAAGTIPLRSARAPPRPARAPPPQGSLRIPPRSPGKLQGDRPADRSCRIDRKHPHPHQAAIALITRSPRSPCRPYCAQVAMPNTWARFRQGLHKQARFMSAQSQIKRAQRCSALRPPQMQDRAHLISRASGARTEHLACRGSVVCCRTSWLSEVRRSSWLAEFVTHKHTHTNVDVHEVTTGSCSRARTGSHRRSS